MSRLNRNIDFIRVLAKSKKQQRDALLNTADQDLILCLADCALNILNGNIPLNPEQYKKLGRYKGALRNLTNKKIKSKQKKELIVKQKGGFVPLLLAPILSVAGSLIADAITRK